MNKTRLEELKRKYNVIPRASTNEQTNAKPVEHLSLYQQQLNNEYLERQSIITAQHVGLPAQQSDYYVRQPNLQLPGRRIVEESPRDIPDAPEESVQLSQAPRLQENVQFPQTSRQQETVQFPQTSRQQEPVQFPQTSRQQEPVQFPQTSRQQETVQFPQTSRQQETVQFGANATSSAASSDFQGEFSGFYTRREVNAGDNEEGNEMAGRHRGLSFSSEDREPSWTMQISENTDSESEPEADRPHTTANIETVTQPIQQPQIIINNNNNNNSIRHLDINLFTKAHKRVEDIIETMSINSFKNIEEKMNVFETEFNKINTLIEKQVVQLNTLKETHKSKVKLGVELNKKLKDFNKRLSEKLRQDQRNLAPPSDPVPQQSFNMYDMASARIGEEVPRMQYFGIHPPPSSTPFNPIPGQVFAPQMSTVINPSPNFQFLRPALPTDSNLYQFNQHQTPRLQLQQEPSTHLSNQQQLQHQIQQQPQHHQHQQHQQPTQNHQRPQLRPQRSQRGSRQQRNIFRPRFPQ